MIINQVEAELIKISQRLISLTVEIINHRSGGSGIIWSADGIVVTNAHVVRGSEVKVKLEDNILVKGLVIARDDKRDLAAIQTKANKLLPSPVIRETPLRPGEIVFAMGSPWGYRGSLTTGVIHTTHWQDSSHKLGLNGQNCQTNDYPLIVADLSLAPGNSGGILADALGRVIGINTAIVNGLAIAIPSQQIQDFVQQVR